MGNGQWENDGGLRQESELQYILTEEIFDWLKDQYFDFPGNKAEYNEERKYKTVDAIKKTFVTAAIETSSTLPEPLDKKSMEPVINGWLNILPDTQNNDYDSGSHSSNIYIALNPSPDGKTVDAIGAIADDWHLKIVNWKGKSKNDPGKDTTINIKSRSVNYTDTKILDKHYDAAKKQFGHI
ncbi:hypothetical protein G5647_03245 [Pectobacterium carotovorum]|uniref:hypothetical protein n=1 Tax=Pectobacterium carotovorum TaxID=554 RepID=UPI00191FBF79|nr:hypothetical protein [Pectobacterium carotovorum]MBL0865419.1 hypothetical protein [Pectobacterium carotovorum]